MYATNTWNGWRGSWFATFEAALEYAQDMMGVVAIEEIGVGIVWCAYPRLFDVRFPLRD